MREHARPTTEKDKTLTTPDHTIDADLLQLRGLLTACCQQCDGGMEDCELCGHVRRLNALEPILETARVGCSMYGAHCDLLTHAAIVAFWSGYVAKYGLTRSELVAFDMAATDPVNPGPGYTGAPGYGGLPDVPAGVLRSLCPGVYNFGVNAGWKWMKEFGLTCRGEHGAERVYLYPEQIAWIVNFGHHIPPFVPPIAMLRKPLAEYLEPVPQGEPFPDASTVYVVWPVGEVVSFFTGRSILETWGTLDSDWESAKRSEFNKVQQALGGGYAKALSEGWLSPDLKAALERRMSKGISEFWPEFGQEWPQDMNSFMVWWDGEYLQDVQQVTPWPESAVTLDASEYSQPMLNNAPVGEVWRVKREHVAHVWPALHFIGTMGRTFCRAGGAPVWVEGWPWQFRWPRRIWPAIEGATLPAPEPGGETAPTILAAPRVPVYPPLVTAHHKDADVIMYVLRKAHEAGREGVTLRDLKRPLRAPYCDKIAGIVAGLVSDGTLKAENRRVGRGPTTVAYVYASC